MDRRISSLRYCIFRLREAVRLSPIVSKSLYLFQNFQASFNGRLLPLRPQSGGKPKGIALCLRFRDEARYLDEWITYHLAAGISHFFLYNNFSDDDYLPVLEPHITRGYVTLIDWPRKPASPAAEEDCIARCIGVFEWVGFLDADEFVVIQDGRVIPAYLNEFQDFPAVALHWYYFGSSGHRTRPSNGVINAYIRRKSVPNRHVKCFVRPESVAQNRNPHSWFFRRARFAVNEYRSPVFGSIGAPTADQAWINHYYCKSLEDYLEKANRKNTHDAAGINRPSRLSDMAEAAMQESNDIEDLCAIKYFHAHQNTLLAVQPA